LAAAVANQIPSVVVALAAKLARIIWAVLRHEKSFDQEVLAIA
jgi:hypothetical protein